MKQELITISSAAILGALSRGVTGVVTETSSNTVKGVVNGVVSLGTGFLAVKVKGSDTKSSLLRGSALGICIAHGLELFKNVCSSDKIASKLSSDTAVGRFMQKAAGLSGGVNGLNGYIDAYGNYHEDGLGGYIDVSGNYVEDGLNGYEADSLNGYYDDAGNYFAEGLGGYIDVNGNYIEDGLAGYQDEEGLGAYIDERGNYIL